jgi:DNA-binding GntR family transcriptional regulator
MDDKRAVRRIRHQSVTDQVAGELRRMVLARHFSPGERLTQEKVAKLLGVSTMPVREAMLRLAAEGLIVAEPNRSFAVAHTTLNDLRDIFWTFGVVGGQLSRMACENADDELIATLAFHHRTYLTVLEDEDDRFEQNWQFFRAINLAARSPRIVWTLRSTLRFFPDLLNAYPGTARLAARWQKDLLRDFKKRDSDAAARTYEGYAKKAGELYIAGVHAMVVQDSLTAGNQSGLSALESGTPQ